MANPTIVHAATSTTLTFLRLHGVPQPLAERVEIIERPGVDGQAFRATGTRSEAQTWRSLVDLADAASCKTVYQSYRTQRGRIVTLTDELGNAWSTVVVLDVRQVRAAKVGTFAGGLNSPSSHILECEWTLQFAE